MNENGSGTYSREEISALRGIFSLYDVEATGCINLAELEGVLSKVGHTHEDADQIIASARDVAINGTISFDDFIMLLEQAGPAGAVQGPDPKVMEFLRILEEYRCKCEMEGNYKEAGRAHRQLEVLRKQEMQRQQKAVRARQLGERQDVQVAHNMQFQDFNAAWTKYLEEYDRMAQMYIQQMTERHAVALLELQQKLQKDVQDKPPKWSKELLEWRRRQHLLARQRNYAEAQKVKKIAEDLEDSEREAMHEMHSLFVARKEAGYRALQQAELQALLKRIDARRREHLKQRSLDSKRLLQRNRNVQAVLEAKQSVEAQKLVGEIRKSVLEATTLTTPPEMTKDLKGSRKGTRPRSKKSEENGMDGDRTFLTTQEQSLQNLHL